MIVVNFSHPLTADQRAELETLAEEAIGRVNDVSVDFDDQRPFADQVVGLIARSGLTAEEWQTLPIVVNLPAYGPIDAVLLAYLHGMCGHFPTMLRLRPGSGTPAPRFELAELVRLDQVRRLARSKRHGDRQ